MLNLKGILTRPNGELPKFDFPAVLDQELELLVEDQLADHPEPWEPQGLRGRSIGVRLDEGFALLNDED